MNLRQDLKSDMMRDRYTTFSKALRTSRTSTTLSKLEIVLARSAFMSPILLAQFYLVMKYTIVYNVINLVAKTKVGYILAIY
jgi:hypothetical protein